MRDAREIAPQALMPEPDPIPGWRVLGSLWSAERFVVRIPKRWNGRLAVVGTPAQRSEFACDLLFSDPLLARGYAYVCGNKGQGDGSVLLERGAWFEVDGVRVPRFLLPDGRGVSFWQHAPGHTIERWHEEFLAIARTAQEILTTICGRPPEHTYAIGLSNGGYQVRRAVEESDLFTAALTWNAVLWTPEHNVLRQLPEAVEAMEAAAPERLKALGFPPDVRGISGGSLYEKNLMMYWRVTAWLHAMHIDPQTSLAYRDVADPAPAEAWNERIGAWRFDRSARIAQRVARFANTGRIRCPLVELASEYDHLISPAVHFVPYRRMVEAAGKGELYRGEMIARAQHVDRWCDDPEYPGMALGYPRVMAALDELFAMA
ncbi:hypothetical protein EPN44_12405 [bacterium]|nr:MAG: hypothetical protein EPN44_12405 [bacterium]